ncbi:MAG: DUF2460 domain-containing protein [Pseudomonadota bacterium]
MSFHEVRFPTDVSLGAAGGPERRTEIVTLSNGFEERNAPWSTSRHRYDAGVGMRSLDDLERIVAFFEARAGQLFGFRWKDWGEYKSCKCSDPVGAVDQVIGTGDGVQTVYQLTKTYYSGAHAQVRPIRKPVAETVRVAVDGVERFAPDFAVDDTTGEVTFDVAPVEGAPVTAGFEFDVPVRFDTEAISVSVSAFAAGEIPSVPIVEVRV